MAKVVFSGVDKIISVLPTCSELCTRVDVYSEWKRWVASGNLQFLPAFRYSGGDTIIDNQKSIEIFVMLNGWKIQIDHDCTIDGTILSDNNTTPFVSSKNLVLIANRTADHATGSNVGSAPSTAQIASAIRSELSPELARIDVPISSLQSNANGGLTAVQSQMLLEMYELLGLDPTKPLVVTSTSRTAGSIHQTINSSSTETLVMRT